MQLLEQIKFLKELQAIMKHEDEHDYDCQASPRFWAIMDYRVVPTGEDYADKTAYIHNDGDHTEFDSFQELKDFLEEYYSEDDEHLNEIDDCQDFDDLWEYATANDEDGYFNEVPVKKESFVVPDTMFLTKEEAKRHLELNHYHYTSKAHTYAMTAWRAPKVEKLLDTLMTMDFEQLENMLKVKR